MRDWSYEFRPARHRMNGAGFPHSEIFGSKRACRSPKLIAACCVLHRLMKPRHSSIAVTGLCKRSQYSRRLFYPLTLKTTLNFQRTKLYFAFIPTRHLPAPALLRPGSGGHPAQFSRLAAPSVAPQERRMVGPDGLEPSTPRLSSACSNQLSYEPKIGK